MLSYYFFVFSSHLDYLLLLSPSYLTLLWCQMHTGRKNKHNHSKIYWCSPCHISPVSAFVCRTCLLQCQHGCVFSYLGSSHCCGSDHAHAWMHTQAQIKFEFFDFFDKMFRNNGTWFKLSSTWLVIGWDCSQTSW